MNTSLNNLDSEQPFEAGTRVPSLIVIFPDENKRAIFPYIHMLLPHQRQNEIRITYSVGEVQIRFNHLFQDALEEFLTALAECSVHKLIHRQGTFSVTVLIREGEELIPL
jgi:hypothetical protein